MGCCAAVPPRQNDQACRGAPNLSQETVCVPEMPKPNLHEETVKALACRGFTLRSLLKFMRRLPVAMPHYDAAKTTTADVVWQVIIPETAERGCSYAELMNNGAKIAPDKMYTHVWSSVFGHTIAAVFADVLGERDFWHLLHLLDPRGFTVDGLGVLEARLSDANLLDRTCWLCIFCVAQHVSICNAPWGGKDTITGQAYSPCTCNREKFHSGDRCEMNKFDDMLLHFVQQTSNYQHVAIADSQLVVFTRIWAIAEVAEAIKLNIPLKIILFKPDVGKLVQCVQELKVEKAKASRPQDVEFILSKIEDKDSFNQKVQVSILKTVYKEVAQSMWNMMNTSYQNIGQNRGGGMLQWQRLIQEFLTVWRDQQSVGLWCQALDSCSMCIQVEEKWKASPVGGIFEAMNIGQGGRSNADQIPEMRKLGDFTRKADKGGIQWLLRNEGNASLFPSDYCSVLEVLCHGRLEYEGQRPFDISGGRNLEMFLRNRVPALVAVVVKGGLDERRALEKAFEYMFGQRAPHNYSRSGRTDFGCYGASIMFCFCENSAEPSVVLHRGTVYEGTLRFDVPEGRLSHQSLAEFILRSALPRFGEFTELSRIHYATHATRGLLVACFPLAEDDLAKKYTMRNEEEQEVEKEQNPEVEPRPARVSVYAPHFLAAAMDAPEGVPLTYYAGDFCQECYFEFPGQEQYWDAMDAARCEDAPLLLFFRGDVSAQAGETDICSFFWRSVPGEHLSAGTILEFVHGALEGNIEPVNTSPVSALDILCRSKFCRQPEDSDMPLDQIEDALSSVYVRGVAS